MTASSSATTRRECGPLLADRTGRAVLKGVVDFAALRGPWIEDKARSVHGGAILRCQGAEVTLDPARARWAFSPGRLTIVCGNPRLEAAPVDPSRVHDAPGDLIRSLRGRFSVVIVDADERSAVLATDRFGVLPLCWTRDGSTIGFSDRADTVPTASRRRLDLQAIYNYVYFHVIPIPRTAFMGIHRLDAAHSLQCSASSDTLSRTWTPGFLPAARASDRQLMQRFLVALEQAVARAAGGEVAIGAFLSGGTDSSTVAGMLRRVTGQAVPTYSIGFDAVGYDEMAYARIAARHFDTAHREYYFTPRDLCERIPRAADHFDQPFGNSSVLPAIRCAELAHADGVRRLLAGDGGDELFGGNLRYAKQKVFDWYWRVPGALRETIGGLLLTTPAGRLSVLRKAASYVSQARVPMPARMETYNLLDRFGASTVLTPQFLDCVRREEPVQLQAEVYAAHADAALVDAMLAYDWRFTLADNDLPKVRYAAAIAGVDVGFPLLDDDIVDLSLAIGPEDKVRGLKLRHFFKAALADFLPQEIIDKPKHGFGLPVGPWLVSDSEFRQLARRSLDGLAQRCVIHPALVEDLFSSRLAEHAGYYGEMVWILMMLEQWLCQVEPDFGL